MTPERWQHVKQIFQSAIELPPSERDSFISRACGNDPELRSEVESLISSHNRADSSVLTAVVNDAAHEILADEAGSLVGQQVGPFKVTERIGSGGMGEVFLAQDTRLGRKVALKLLKDEYTKDEDRLRRFQQEARAVSALNHPNILTLYDIGQVDSVHFMATEYVEGNTLRQHIARGRMSLGDVLDVTIQAAGALAAAHNVGITHRDIKPENIMLRTDGYVKVLDFGLAKLVEPKSGDTTAPTLTRLDTESGVIVGTVSYMSPEHARGLGVDGRTDIWSLGVVVYELAAGCHPFGGKSLAEMISAILNQDPPLLSSHSTDVPAELQRILSKSLQKEREARYQTANDLLIDLKNLRHDLELKSGRSTAETQQFQTRSRAGNLITQIQRRKMSATLLLIILIIAIAGILVVFRLANKSKPTQASAALRAVAVLPFKQLGSASSDDYLGVGLADALITRLSNLSQIIVRPTDAVLKYAQPDQDHAAAGRELGADLMLDGRIQRSGDNLRLTVQLVNVKDGRPLWADQYDEKFTDLFKWEDSISQRVAQALALRLSGDVQHRLGKRPTDNADAYEEYLKGRFQMLHYTYDGFKSSLTHLNRAIALDPTYAMAYAGLADAYCIASNDYLAPREVLPKAEEAALKAVSFDEELAEAHAALGHAKLHRYDWSCEKDLQRALELNPNSVPVLLWYGEYWNYRDPSKAVPILQRAQQLDPLSPAVGQFLVGAIGVTGQPDEYLREAQKWIEIDPNNPYSHANFALANIKQRKYLEAIAEFNKARQLGGPPWVLSLIGYTYAVIGKKEEARKILVELRNMSKQQFIAPFVFANVYIGLGEKDQAIAWLEKAYEEGDELLGASRFFFWMEPLHSDPRYRALMQRLGLESQRLESESVK
jgi:serine/threonine protein kinase/TolB-like protein